MNISVYTDLKNPKNGHSTNQWLGSDVGKLFFFCNVHDQTFRLKLKDSKNYNDYLNSINVHHFFASNNKQNKKPFLGNTSQGFQYHNRI